MKRHAPIKHIFRVIWSQVLNTWVAVAKSAKGRGNSGTGRKRIAAALALAGCVFLSPILLASPVGGQVSAGNGTIAQVGTTTTINQSSQNLAINWQSFGIAANETVNFAQPNAAAIALNRVTGQSPSQILGNINANGQVFVLNPNGVLFGAGSQVNVGGLVASTLSLSDADFMAGKNSFSGTSGSIVNQGTLNSTQVGYIALLSPEVRNEGVITATLGTALLAAGDKITLNLNNGSLVSYSIDQGSLNALADNKQFIQADGGQVFMSAKAANTISTAVVNNTGIIEARTLQNVGGVIKLMGDMQVGQVNVGGTLDASAANGGNGGLIETSAAHVKVANNTTVSTFSPNGKSGTWLIDPVDFTIAATGGDMTGAVLSTSLGGGNVIIQSVLGTTGTVSDVNVNDVVTWSANHLTLNAQNNININANLNGSGTASLALEYGQQAVNLGNTSDFYINNSAQVNLPAGQNFSTKLGNDGVVKNFTVITDLGFAGSVSGTDLQGMNGNLAGNYVLGADIETWLSSSWNSNLGFMPIGNATNQFVGTFDGLGHTVNNITNHIDRNLQSYSGLFGYSRGYISNVGLTVSVNSGFGSVSGVSYVGGLVGYNAGTIKNSYSTLAVTGRTTDIGGLVGYNSGYIINSYATGSVSPQISAGNLGGLVGKNDWMGNISNSNANGKVGVSNLGGRVAGGLVGYNLGNVNFSFATGVVSGGNNLPISGGLVGANGITGIITNSYATGQSEMGGLVGDNSGTVSNCYATGQVSGTSAGGLVGNNIGNISNSYTTGNVGGSFAGGIVGYNTGTVRYVYATGKVSGAYSGALVGQNLVGGVLSYGYYRFQGITAVGFGNPGV